MNQEDKIIYQGDKIIYQEDTIPESLTYRAQTNGRRTIRRHTLYLGNIKIMVLVIPGYVGVDLHGHEDGWSEVYVYPEGKQAKLCPKDEKHFVTNFRRKTINVIGVQCSDEKLLEGILMLLKVLKYQVAKGSLTIRK